MNNLGEKMKINKSKILAVIFLLVLSFVSFSMFTSQLESAVIKSSGRAVGYISTAGNIYYKCDQLTTVSCIIHVN